MRVWTNGCFDVLHRGHIELFKYAKSLGEELIVGIDTDEKVKKDKGKDRPINCLNDRIDRIGDYSTTKILNTNEGVDPYLQTR